jgi:hypothetical protein
VLWLAEVPSALSAPCRHQNAGLDLISRQAGEWSNSRQEVRMESQSAEYRGKFQV